MLLEIVKIRTDGGTQSRDGINGDHVADLRKAIQAGKELPPIVVFYDGSEYWNADGFHRIDAYELEGRQSLPADIRQGTRREAILHSVGANAEHGLKRTRADVRRAVGMLLRDDEWRRLPDREIARLCNTTHPTVAAIREEIYQETAGPSGKSYQMQAEPRSVSRGGTSYQMNVSNIGKSAYRNADAERPSAAPARPQARYELEPEEEPEYEARLPSHSAEEYDRRARFVRAMLAGIGDLVKDGRGAARYFPADCTGDRCREIGAWFIAVAKQLDMPA